MLKTQQLQRVLVYKRTHTGDPDAWGRFGINGCMGQVRTRKFDAVIGIGGIGRQAVEYKIDGLITWIGIGPTKIGEAFDGFPIWAFDRFYLKDAKGLQLEDFAPKLAKRLLKSNGPRSLMLRIDGEINAVLNLAKRARSSKVCAGVVESPTTCRKPTKC